MRALSLEYHDVFGADPDESGFPGAGPASYKLTRVAFESHLRRIAASRIGPTPTVTAWAAGAAGSERPLFFTFDDGGLSAYTMIADALEAHGWRGHFFMTAARIGTPTFLSPSQLRQLSARGHVIGSHSYSHPVMMGTLDEESLREEWHRSTAALADLLGQPVLTASVPGGYYTRRVAETASAAGIRFIFTSAPSTSCVRVRDCLVMGRYTLRRWSGDRTAAGIAAGHIGPRFTQWAIYGGLSTVRRLGGRHYTRLRQAFWARRS